LGIFGILCAITSIPAIILGHLALREIDAQPTKYSGRAQVMVGLILGWVFLCLSSVIIVVSVISGLAQA
jgi:hypothetical protein